MNNYAITYKHNYPALIHESLEHFRCVKAKWIQKFYTCNNHNQILLSLFPEQHILLQQIHDCEYTAKIDQWQNIYQQIYNIENRVEKLMFLLYLHYMLVFLTNDYHQVDMLNMLGKKLIPLHSYNNKYIFYLCQINGLIVQNMHYYEIIILLAKTFLVGKLSDMQKLLIQVTYQLPAVKNIAYLGKIPRAQSLLQVLPYHYLYNCFQDIEQYYDMLSNNNFSYHNFNKLLKRHKQNKDIAYSININLENSPFSTLWYILSLVYNKWRYNKII